MPLDYQNKTYRILKNCGAFVEGSHFVYSSGRHGDFYINKDALYMYPKKTDDICVMMSDLALQNFGDRIDCVLAPAIAGIVLGQNISYNLSLELGKEVLFSYSERNVVNNTYRTIRRGYEKVLARKRVLLVDDIVNTGATLTRMFESVSMLGSIVVGAIALCDRGQIRVLKMPTGNGNHMEVCISSLVELDSQTFPADNCPLCKSGRPIEMTIGEGRTINLFDNVNKVEDNNDKGGSYSSPSISRVL